jgi:hypothetical protein
MFDLGIANRKGMIQIDKKAQEKSPISIKAAISKAAKRRSS